MYKTHRVGSVNTVRLLAYLDVSRDKQKKLLSAGGGVGGGHISTMQTEHHLDVRHFRRKKDPRYGKEYIEEL